MRKINGKKVVSVLICVLLLSVFTACSQSESGDEFGYRSDIKVTKVTFEAPEGVEYDKETGSGVIENGDTAVYFNYWKSSEKNDYRYFDDFDEELCRGFEGKALEEVYGKTIDFEITRFDKFVIDDIPAYRFDEKYTVDGKDIVYTAIMVGADEIYNFNYEQNGTVDYTEAIEESIKSIHFEYKEK